MGDGGGEQEEEEDGVMTSPLTHLSLSLLYLGNLFTLSVTVIYSFDSLLYSFLPDTCMISDYPVNAINSYSHENGFNAAPKKRGRELSH